MNELIFSKNTNERNQFVRFCYDTVRGVVHNYHKEINNALANEKIRQMFIQYLGTDKLDYKKLRDPSKMNRVFEIIEEVIDLRVEDGFVTNPFFKQFVEFKSTKSGDRPEFYVPNSQSIIISKISGGHWNLNRQRLNAGASFIIQTEWYGAKIYEEFERMLSGRVDFVEMINALHDSVQERIGETIAKEFMGSFDVIPSQFKHTGNFDVQEFLKIIRMVQSANSKNTPIIAGTRSALDVLPDAYAQNNSFLISENMKDAINKNGILPTWRGYKILEIPQFFEQGTFKNAVDDNMLYVLTGDDKPIKFLKEGETIINNRNNPTDNNDMTIEYMLQLKFGVDFILNKYYGVYKVTN